MNPLASLDQRLGARRTGEPESLGGTCWVYSHP